MKVGFIGLGNMGHHMAARLLGGAHELTVFDLNRASGAQLEKAGAAWGRDVASVARESSIVLTSLPGPSQVEAVALGPDGIVASLPAGGTYIDLSTNSPCLIRRIAAVAAARDVRVIDAPVSGGVAGAQAGTLALYVGGDAFHVHAALPMLQLIGSRILEVGPVGSGNVVKLINNLVCFVNLVGASEGLAAAVSAGVDPNIVLKALGSGTGDSWMVQKALPRILIGESLQFGAALAAKDARLAIDLLRELHMPALVSRVVEAMMTRYERAGAAPSDLAELGRRILVESGTKLPG